MAKQKRNSGFTLIEMIVCLAIISVCITFTIPLMHFDVPLRFQADLLESNVLYAQQQAILTQERQGIKLDDFLDDYETTNQHQAIEINAKGNVKEANTITINSNSHSMEVKIWLGFGRVSYETKRDLY